RSGGSDQPWRKTMPSPTLSWDFQRERPGSTQAATGLKLPAIGVLYRPFSAVLPYSSVFL
ncbi:MAG TPA: hypothetical protein VIY29_21485, partial [Ktedonobacteraceae bacterium]